MISQENMEEFLKSMPKTPPKMWSVNNYQTWCDYCEFSKDFKKLFRILTIYKNNKNL